MALSVAAKKKLEAFRHLGNPGDLHPYDHGRWHEFVIQAHTDGSTASDADAVSAFLKEQWTERVSSELGRRFYTDLGLLAAYDESR